MEVQAVASPGTALRKELDAKTDDRRIVAELLGMPVRTVEFGPNLVDSGGLGELDSREQAEGWEWFLARGMFPGGVDRYLDYTLQ